MCNRNVIQVLKLRHLEDSPLLKAVLPLYLITQTCTAIGDITDTWHRYIVCCFNWTDSECCDIWVVDCPIAYALYRLLLVFHWHWNVNYIAWYSTSMSKRRVNSKILEMANSQKGSCKTKQTDVPDEAIHLFFSLGQHKIQILSLDNFP